MAQVALRGASRPSVQYASRSAGAPLLHPTFFAYCGLRELIEESFALHDRIVQLDRAFAAARDPDAVVERPANPVAAQLNLLNRAFNQKLG
jgi:hypothetical protein